MSEHETRMRQRIAALGDDGLEVLAWNLSTSLDALLAEHRTEVAHLKKDKDALRDCIRAAKDRESLARDEALEEAAGYVEGCGGPGDALLDADTMAAEIRALKSKPAGVVSRSIVHDEPEQEVPPGTCPGCDAQETDEPGRHRFGCRIHGKRQVVLPATLEPCDCGEESSRHLKCDGTGYVSSGGES